jgi:mannitol-1-/sugar-/sorbitol-6-phosphatase
MSTPPRTFPVSGLLFDNDGVLSDSLEQAVLAWKRWAAEYAPHFDVDTQFEHGVPARELIARLVKPELVEEAFAALEADEIAVSHNTVALAGARELTASLAVGTWAVVTSATPELARVRLAAAGIDATVVVTADDVSRGKPHPEPYLAGARAIGVEPANCVVFEDAPAGVRAALAAGIGVIVGIGDEVRGEGATLIVDSLAHVSWADGLLSVRDGRVG